MARIGVFICGCGENIGSVVDVESTVGAAAGLPHVAWAAERRYLCSAPGQALVMETIRERGLDALVIAACSPSMHQETFRGLAQRAGINPWMTTICNIREQCAWVHAHEPEAATRKALDLVGMAVSRAACSEPLDPVHIPVTRRALILGGGVAGIQAALDLSDAGIETVLVERSASIGGRMAALSETFPTMDCSQCILTPKMVEAARRPNITILTLAELQALDGFAGDFRARIRVRARSVDPTLCTGCGLCVEQCPVRDIPSEFDEGLSTRTAIHFPLAQAVPNAPVIDRARCLWFNSGGVKCGVCAKVCPVGAVDYSQSDRVVELDAGAVLAATGFDTAGAEIAPEYGGGALADVITGAAFERMASASGPTGGRIIRPSDRREPGSVVFISCVGSRDRAKGIEYCSRICCMYTAKHATMYRRKVPHGRAAVFYMDIRSSGKGYDEFVRSAVEREGVDYIRGRVSRVYAEDGLLVVKGVDTIAGEPVTIRAELVALATAARPGADAPALAAALGISTGPEGFFTELHPKLGPVETPRAGVFLAGACQAPRDIPDTVAQASAAAAKIIGLLARDRIEKDPVIAVVDPARCAGCGTCERTCPHKAAELVELKFDGDKLRKVAQISQAGCRGCGVCAASCRAGAVSLPGFTDAQVRAEVDHLFRRQGGIEEP